MLSNFQEDKAREKDPIKILQRILNGSSETKIAEEEKKGSSHLKETGQTFKV